MFKDKVVAVVVPAHNEEPHIAGVIEGAPDFVDLVIVIDDGSTDTTAEIAERYAGSGVTLLQHAENRGVGSAIVTGYRFAMEQGADVVAVVGGDGQMEADYLPALLEAVVERGFDFAKGNRFSSWRSWQGMPASRAFGNVVLSLLTKPATGYWHVFDAQNGYTAISAETLGRLPLSRLETGYQFENRLLIELNAIGARVADVPIPARYGEEQSGIKAWRDVPAILWALLAGFVMRVYRTYLRERVKVPGLILLFGALLMAAGIVASVTTLVWGPYDWVSRLAVTGLLTGASFICLFILADVRRHAKTQRRSNISPDRQYPAQIASRERRPG